MLCERFEVEGLAHYSYALGDAEGAELAIVDPERNVERYLDFAAAHGRRVAHVLETHIHADFASGARELAARAGATLWLSRYDRAERYEVAFPHRPLGDGDRVELGRVALEARHTPGHTPEHLSFLVHDGGAPVALLSGDFLFVGSVGRPDLLGEAASRGLAERLYASVREVLAGLPNALAIYPAHGAGSFCGAGLGRRPASTLGAERLANPYLAPGLSREDFVARLLASAPPLPPYYRRLKEVNARGPRALSELPPSAPLPAARFHELVTGGHAVIDLRDQHAFGAGHVPGAFGIAAGASLAPWAAWVVPYDTPIVLVAPQPEVVAGAVRALARVGLDDVAGWLDGGFPAWQDAGYPVRRLAQASPEEIQGRLAAGEPLRVLDVRGEEEWRAGHVAGATRILAGELAARLAEVPRGNGELALVCGSGYRSTVAASVLERAGFEDLVNVTGGMTAWRGAGLPTVAGDEEPAAPSG